MLSKIQVQVALAIAAIVWAVMLFVEGVSLKPSYLKPYSLAVSVVILCLIIFDRWLWRIPVVARFLHMPVLLGTWKGELQSSWINPDTGKGIEPIPAFLSISQTYSTISMRLMTKESSSRSLVASLDAPRDEVPRASSTYQNTPSLLIQGRSRIHHGALMLEVHGRPANRMNGFYWTDRDTKGEVLLTAHASKVFTDFEQASSADW